MGRNCWVLLKTLLEKIACERRDYSVINVFHGRGLQFTHLVTRYALNKEPPANINEWHTIELPQTESTLLSAF